MKRDRKGLYGALKNSLEWAWEIEITTECRESKCKLQSTFKEINVKIINYQGISRFLGNDF